VSRRLTSDYHLRVFDQRRPVQLALEKLCGAADPAERILDFVREAADQFAICLLLLEQPFLARDPQLLIDVSELEEQRSFALDYRHRARQMQLLLAVDA